MNRWRALKAIVEVRKTAADVVALADLVIYGNDTKVATAMRLLPARIRALQFRATRALTALEEDPS
jgi:hypothetical protein